MDFQAYNEILICPDAIENVYVDDACLGFEFKIKYPSYRGAFLSCIEALAFWVDGEPIAEADIRFSLNGKQFLVAELPACFKEYWFVRTPAVVRVLNHGALAVGGHTIRVRMRHRVPYTGYFGEYLVLESDKTAGLETQEVRA